jgi:hypothetical protein
VQAIILGDHVNSEDILWDFVMTYRRRKKKRLSAPRYRPTTYRRGRQKMPVEHASMVETRHATQPV